MHDIADGKGALTTAANGLAAAGGAIAGDIASEKLGQGKGGIQGGLAQGAGTLANAGVNVLGSAVEGAPTPQVTMGSDGKTHGLYREIHRNLGMHRPRREEEDRR